MNDATSDIRINVPTQLIVAPLCASTIGFCSGLVPLPSLTNIPDPVLRLMTSTSLASLQFLAENAHCQPTTVQGWYFYNKTKNYRVILAGLKGGIRTGMKLGAWTLGFVGLQEGLVKSMKWEGEGEKGLAGALAGGGLTLAASRICESGYSV